MVRIQSVDLLGGFRVRLKLTDGSSKDVDLGGYLTGPIFDALLADPELFNQVRVDQDLGTLVWPNGADIDPDVLIGGLEPASAEKDDQRQRA